MEPLVAVACRHYTADDIEALRSDLVDVYAEVYADRLDVPFFSVDRFRHRLDRHVCEPNWEAVVGYVEDQLVGYAYGAARAAGVTYWQHVVPVPDAEFARETGERTFALFELMVRAPWRGKGVAHALHDELIHGRREERVSLLVERDHPRVRALYETWGYRHVGVRQPSPDAPILDVMLRDPRDQQQAVVSCRPLQATAEGPVDHE